MAKNSKAELPLVTVITATFNLIKSGRKETFIQSAESVQKQTYKNIEHIVIDGASEDGTLKLLEKYQKKGWFKYYSEPDKGIYDAMNKGILKAKGKYVVCLNSDDLYCNDKAIEMLVQKAEEQDADACYGNATKVNPKTMEVTFDWKGKENFLPWTPAFPCHQTFLIRTDVMKELGLYNLKYKGCADNAFLVRLVQHNKKITNIDEYIITFRDGGFSDNHQILVQQEKQLLLYEELGQYRGWTMEDCSYFVWHKFLQLPLDKAVALGKKLGEPEWTAEYYYRLFNHHLKLQQQRKAVSNPKKSVTKVVYKLFNFIPLLKYRKDEEVTQITVFGFLPIIKIVNRKSESCDLKVLLVKKISLWRDNILGVLLRWAAGCPKKRNKILLMDNIFEKDANIQDNFTLFEYLYKKEKRKIEPYYMINKDSPYYPVLKQKYKSRIIEHSDCKKFSEKLQLLRLVWGLRFIGDSFQAVSLLPFNLQKILRESAQIITIFMQHGITFFKPDFITPGVYGKNVYDKILCSNDMEAQLFMERGGYKEQDIIKNGLMRWNNVQNMAPKQKEKSIFIFFTTRRYLSTMPDVSKSVYIKEIISLLKDKKLQQTLSKAQIKLKTALHHSAREVLKKVFDDLNVEIISEDDIFKVKQEASLLITDYSSMCFEFFLQGKPVIFYPISDAQDCATYGDRSLDIENPYQGKERFLCNIVSDKSKLQNIISQYIKTNFVLTSAEQDCQKQFFYYRSGFCHRMEEYLIENK